MRLNINYNFWKYTFARLIQAILKKQPSDERIILDCIEEFILTDYTCAIEDVVNKNIALEWVTKPFLK